MSDKVAMTEARFNRMYRDIKSIEQRYRLLEEIIQDHLKVNHLAPSQAVPAIDEDK